MEFDRTKAVFIALPAGGTREETISARNVARDDIIRILGSNIEICDDVCGADYVYFCRGWGLDSECCEIHQTAVEQGLKIIYPLNRGERDE